MEEETKEPITEEPIAPPPAKEPEGVPVPEGEKEIGKIVHFYTNLEVAIVELIDALNVGDTIHIKGTTTDFEQKVESIQIEHEQVEKAEKGQTIGLKVNEKVREGDVVYRK